VRVYWYDDESKEGGCRIPADWRVLYRDGTEWKPVFRESHVPPRRDAWNELHFEPVRTDALRLECTAQAGYSTGVIEWEAN
jgi:hypothetical protein